MLDMNRFIHHTGAGVFTKEMWYSWKSSQSGKTQLYINAYKYGYRVRSLKSKSEATVARWHEEKNPERNQNQKGNPSPTGRLPIMQLWVITRAWSGMMTGINMSCTFMLNMFVVFLSVVMQQRKPAFNYVWCLDSPVPSLGESWDMAEHSAPAQGQLGPLSGPDGQESHSVPALPAPRP